MRRSLPLGLALVAAAALGGAAAAETCSSSTLASTDFALARWCGDPPAPGTLRLVRRGGRAEEFLNVPLDTYREVVRTPHVAQYVAEDIAPRFEHGAAAPEPRPARQGRADATGEGADGRPARVRHVVARPTATRDAEEAVPEGPHRRARRHAEEERGGADAAAKASSRAEARRARQAARALEERDR